MKIKHNTQNIFFLSDQHFRHNAVIKYQTRKFKTIEEHDEFLIDQWNKKVGANDIVYHLGDFVIGNRDEIKEIFYRLNGKITFVIGNHDEKLIKFCKKEGIPAFDLIELRVKDQDEARGCQAITLCHYAVIEWNKCHYGGWMLHGHSHNGCVFTEKNNSKYKILDVGVDAIGFAPISYQEVKEKMVGRQNFEHHRRCYE